MTEEKVKKTKIKKEKNKKVRGVAKKKAAAKMIFNKNFLKLVIVPAMLLVVGFFGFSFMHNQIVGFISTLQLPSQLVALIGMITNIIRVFLQALIIFVFIRMIVAKTFEDDVKRPTKLTKSFGGYAVMTLITLGLFILAGFIGNIAYAVLGNIYLWGLFIASATMSLTIFWIIVIAFLNLMFSTAIFIVFIAVIATLASAFISNDHKVKGTFAQYGVLTCGRNVKTLLQPLRFAHWIILLVLIVPIFAGMIMPLVDQLTSTITNETALAVASYVGFGLVFFVIATWVIALFVYVVGSIGYYVLVPAPKQKVVIDQKTMAKLKEIEEKEALIENPSEEVEFQKALDNSTAELATETNEAKATEVSKEVVNQEESSDKENVNEDNAETILEEANKETK